MTIAVLIWQAIIFFTIYVSGAKRGWPTAFWVVWTMIQVYTLPLTFLQFATILIAYKFAGKRRAKRKVLFTTKKGDLLKLDRQSGNRPDA